MCGDPVSCEYIGLQGLAAKICPFWARQNSGSKFADYIQAPTYSTCHSHSKNTFNRSFDQFKVPQSCSLPLNNLKWVEKCRSGVYTHKYFHATHLVNNQPHWIDFPFQMSWPTIVKCYEEIVEDLTLLWLFLPEEYSSVQGLPCLCALQFILIWRGFSPMLPLLAMGKDQGGIFHPNWSEGEWGSYQVGDPHHQWGRREGLGYCDGFLSP